MKTEVKNEVKIEVKIEVKTEAKIEELVYSLLYKVIKCQISIEICCVKLVQESGQQCHFRNSREEMELKVGQQCQFTQ